MIAAEVPTEATTAARPGARVSTALLVILCAGVAVRVALWFWFADRTPQIFDEKTHDRLAVNLVQYGEFAEEPGEPLSLRPPLYPMLVAGIYAVCGLENYQAARLFQAALSLVTVFLVYRLGAALYTRRVGLWAAGICCFYPSLLGYNNLILTEVLFTFLLVLFSLLLVHSLQSRSLGFLAAAGVALGLAALTRSVLWLFPPVLGVFLLWAWPDSLSRRAGAVVLMLAASSLTIAPWAVRNTFLQETFVAVDVMGGRNFMMGNYRHTPLYRSWDAISLEGEKSWAHELFANTTAAQCTTQGQVDKLALRHGLKFVFANPGLTLQRDMIKFFDFWGLERELIAGAARGYFGPFSRPALVLLTVAVAGSYALALFLGVFGLCLAPSANRRLLYFLLLIVLFITGMHTLVFGHSRYHVPLMPLIFVFAAAALVSAPEIWRLRTRVRFWCPCAICLSLLASWLWLFAAVDRKLAVEVVPSSGGARHTWYLSEGLRSMSLAAATFPDPNPRLASGPPEVASSLVP